MRDRWNGGLGAHVVTELLGRDFNVRIISRTAPDNVKPGLTRALPTTERRRPRLSLRRLCRTSHLVSVRLGHRGRQQPASVCDEALRKG